MDPRYTFRKGYDTDLLILRSLFALNSNTNQPISSFYTVVADGIGGVQWLSPTEYFSCATGILNFVSSVESFSTVSGLYSNFSTQSFSNFITSSINTYFISSQTVEVSSLRFLDRRGNSTQEFTMSSGSLYLNDSIYFLSNTVFTSSLVSSVIGLGTAGYISSSQLQSTINGLGKMGLGYVNYTALDAALASTVAVLGSNTPNLTSTTAGVYTYINLVGTNTSNYANTQVNTASNALNLTIQNSLVSTTIGVTVPAFAFPSTIGGLANVGYVSSSQLQSTVGGLATAGYISSSQLISTLGGLATAGYISSSQLVSTVAGLGGSGLISTGQLVSSLVGLGTLGYISSLQLQSTVIGLGGTGLVSTGQLVSTTIGLSNLIVPASGVNIGQLTSTVTGLTNNFYVVNASQVFVTNSRVSVSSAQSLIVFSTFMMSSITYQGNNGQITASNAAGPTAPFYFSSATVNLDRWSSFIASNSVVTLEFYPKFFFGNLGLPGNPSLIFMSSFVQAGGNNFTSSFMFQTAIYPTIYENGRSNSVDEAMRITMPGSVVQGFYPQPTRIAHYLPNALTVGGTQGFSNTNVSIFYGSTNSVFVSIQNLPIPP